MTELDELDLNNVVNFEGKWVINEEFDLAYLFGIMSQQVASDTDTNTSNDFWSKIDALILMCVPLKSSFATFKKLNEADRAFFEVPARHASQRSILFSKVDTEPAILTGSEEVEAPQFSHYGLKPC